jgi:uncharacterized protein (DUF779 family)
MSTLLPGAVGPAAYVDPVSYRNIRARARIGYVRKRKVGVKAKAKGRKKKKTYKKKPFRRNWGYRGYGRDYHGSGPIVITGRGGYWTDKFKRGLSAGYTSLKRGLPEGSFSRLGRAAGGAMFGAPGASIGGYAGSLVSRLAGFGAYTVNRNSLMLGEGEPIPTFANMSQATIVTHREYIKDIVGPATGATFTLDTFPINPGHPKTFPWLSQIAKNYDQYSVLGMVFEFKSTSSDSLNTGVLGLGTIILATDYDSADANYSSKIEMENSQFAITTKPNCDAIHPIECDSSFQVTEIKYCREISVPTGRDIRLYDHGTFELATQGLPNAAGTLGELWVSYQVAFYKPQFLVQGAGSITDHFTLSTSITAANKLTTGAVQQADVGSSIGGTIQNLTYTFPAYIQSGRYLMHYAVRGATTPLTVQLGWTIPLGLNGQVLWINDTVDTIHPYSVPMTYDVASDLICVTVTGPGASLQLTAGGSLPTAITGGDLIVTSIDADA